MASKGFFHVGSTVRFRDKIHQVTEVDDEGQTIVLDCPVLTFNPVRVNMGAVIPNAPSVSSSAKRFAETMDEIRRRRARMSRPVYSKPYLSRPCRSCGAEVGAPCHTTSGAVTYIPHKARVSP